MADVPDPDMPVGLKVRTLTYPVPDDLVGSGPHVRSGDPQRMPTSWPCDHTIDGEDAFEFAGLGRIGELLGAHIPNPDVLKAFELIRVRKDVVEQCAQVKQRLGRELRREGNDPSFDGKTLDPREGRSWLAAGVGPKKRFNALGHLRAYACEAPRNSQSGGRANQGWSAAVQQARRGRE